MNHTNLNHVINRYMDTFYAFYNKTENDSSENDFWSCFPIFQKNWDLEASDFTKMFHLSCDALLNTEGHSEVQPVSGIFHLLKDTSNATFVQAAFRSLFQADNLAISARQKQSLIFIDQINAQLNLSQKKTSKFLQNRMSVLAYLSLWNPAENYLYKPKEATLWANYMEYTDDFGSGKSFSLEKYYQMCEETKEAVASNTNLMNLARTYFFDEKLKLLSENIFINKEEILLHWIVFDLMYFAKKALLYEGITVKKYTAKQRVRRAELNTKKDSCKQRLIELEKMYEELKEKENRSKLPDLTGQNVVHHKFGEGTVQKQGMGMLIVSFAKDKKNFQFPESIANGFLVLNDRNLLDEIQQAAKTKKRLQNIEKEISSYKQELQYIENAE